MASTLRCGVQATQCPSSPFLGDYRPFGESCESCGLSSQKKRHIDVDIGIRGSRSTRSPLVDAPDAHGLQGRDLRTWGMGELAVLKRVPCPTQRDGAPQAPL